VLCSKLSRGVLLGASLDDVRLLHCVLSLGDRDALERR
jgi:hypothetical protein